MISVDNSNKQVVFCQWRNLALMTFVCTCILLIFYTYASDTTVVFFNSFSVSNFLYQANNDEDLLQGMDDDSMMATASSKAIFQCAQHFASHKDELEEALANASQKKLILFWAIPFGNMKMITMHDNLNRSRCGNCQLTTNRNMINSDETGAVIFHFNEAQSPAALPSKRDPKQLYVWWSKEGTQALKMRSLKLDNFDNMFNLTMSYRRDADVLLPYDTAVGLQDELAIPSTDNMSRYLDDLMSKKTKLAIWIASNGYMRGAKERQHLSDVLINAGLNLDRRGRLYPRSPPIPEGRGPKFTEFIKSYKFYMSFENQWHCKSYITEKAWNNGLRAETVPVVWGARKEDYEAVLPPGSFIYASDYTAEALVEYLLYLDKNDTAYREYFNWRTMDRTKMPDHYRETGFCQLCRIMHGIDVDNLCNKAHTERYSSTNPLFTDNKKNTSTYIVKSLAEVMYGSEYDECH